MYEQLPEDAQIYLESDDIPELKEEDHSLLDEIIDFLKPFAFDENNRITDADTMKLAFYLDCLFAGQGPFTIIGAFQRANSTANLVTSGSNFLVQKQHLHEDQEWLLHFNVLNEIYSMLVIQQRLREVPYFPKLVHVSVNANTTKITSNFIPLSFQEIFTKNLPTMFIKQRVIELLTAVHLLHNTLHLAHRDIKPENIRLQADGTLVLLDFDTCCPRHSETWWTRPVCSAHTRAPELYVPPGTEAFNMTRYNGYATDIFSSACVILCMSLECKLPFVNEPQDVRIKQIKNFASTNVTKMKIITKIGEEGFDLVTKMLSFDYCNRPTIRECLQHSYFSN